MIRRYRRLLTSLLVSALFVSVPVVQAQTTSGRIAGMVLDSSGAVLPGVTVTVTETSIGIQRTATTDAQGAYVFVSLPRGTYSVTAELGGFKKALRTGNELVADGRVTVDFRMEVGQLTETLEVMAPGETVNTTSGELARTVDREQVQNLALNGRNYMQLATLIPGSPLLNDAALDIMTGLSINTSVNGSRANQSLLMVDGGFNMDSGSNNSQISNVGIDFIQEVNIKTANFSAEYGRNSGAAINVVTRSGGNDFKGSLFGYRRDERFDANDYFSNARNVKKAPLDYNNFGWSLGGPVQKNKLFIFGGQEWKQIDRLVGPNARTLPTRAMRNGDFSGVTTPIKDPVTGLPFPGNVIPTSRITTDGRALANVYSAMEGLATSYTDTPTTNNSQFQDPNPFRWREDLVRLDYQASNNQRLTLRVIIDTYNLTDPYGTFINSNLPTIPTVRNRPGRNIQFTDMWTVSPTLINEFKAGGAWNSQRINPEGEAWMRDTYGFAFPQIYSGGGKYDAESIPDVTIQNYAGFTGAAQSLMSPTTDITISDNLTWLKGAHTVKGGGLYVRNRKDQNGRSRYAGNLTFNTSNPNSTGNAFADALLGNFQTYQEAAADLVGFFRFSQVEAFATDNWRLSKSLSVEVGLRYMWHQPIYTQANNMSNFVPALYDPAAAVTVNRNGTLVPGVGNRYNGIILAGDGIPAEEVSRVPTAANGAGFPTGAPRGFYPNRHLIMPRFSFAWSPNATGKTAVRGGVGLFYDRSEGNLLFGGGANGPINNPPYSLSSSYSNGNLASPGGGATPVLSPIGDIAALDPDMGVPSTWSYSLNVQRELIGGIFGEIGYVGSRGSKLLRTPDINQASFADLGANAALPAAQRAAINYLRPYKGYSAIYQRIADADSSYDALQLFLSKRRGTFRWTFSYTLGNSTDNASGNADNPEDFENKSYNEGPSDFDRHHIVVGTWTAQLPFFKEQKGIGLLLGGWELSGIGRYQTGAPFTVTGNTAIGARRADFLGGDPYVSSDNRVDPTTGFVQWLVPSAFAAAPEDRRGNSSRGQFRGPSVTVFDLSLRKQFAVTHRVNLQLQADVFNALNHTNFRNPAAVVTNADFGRITAAAPPRNVQLGLRLTF